MAPQNEDVNEISDEELQAKNLQLQFGNFLAHPLPGEDLVISGISGCYPNSDTVTEFQENLFNKADLVSDDERRWTPFHPEIPQRTGKINDIEEHDAGFFGNHFRQANNMDPLIRLLLQRSIEAICDAGINPKDLENTNTGVFVGACFSESERKLMTDLKSQDYGLTGCLRSMIANRLSYYLKLKGPSFITDTACSSSLYALEHAYKSIRMGQCDQAIIGGTSICLHPFVSLQFQRLGVLSKDGSCKVFDDAGNGYARSEAICAIFLQKSKDAKRIYAHVLHAKTNCDGFKGEGITYPSGEMQTRLLNDFYDECKIDPKSLSYLEAHGTGTRVGDPEEVSSIDTIFCTGRETPLLIGSVKSNIGHTEPASGLCSLTKCIIAFETGYIPPNLHYSKPRVGVKALEEGRLEVVTKKMPFRDNRGIIGINSFGFGGGNCHILLKWNSKVKQNKLNDDLPRLTCVSGRVEQTVHLLLEDIKNTAVDVEFIKLLHSLYRENHNYHFYRGYSIVSKSGELSRSVRYHKSRNPKVHFIFGELTYAWQQLGKNLYSLPIFAASLQRVQKFMSLKNINIIDLIFGEKTEDLALSIIGNVAVQIGIIEIIRKLEIIPDSICGFGLGELLCAYYDTVFTLEEVLEFSCAIALTADSLKHQSELFLVVTSIDLGIQKNYNVVATISENSFIIFDDTNKFKEFVKDNDNIVARTLNFSLINFHDKKFMEMSSQIFGKIIVNPQKWSKKRINSYDKLVTAENFVNSITNISSIGNVVKMFSKDDVVLEIGNGHFLPLLQLVSKNDLNTVSLINLEKDLSLIAFLESLGSIYELGVNHKLEHLYPTVEFPVSRNTPMISKSYKWNRQHQWNVAYYKNDEGDKGIAEKKYNIFVKYPEYSYITGHVIDGRNIFPATGYLNLVWEAFSNVKCSILEDMKMVFENCRFHRATNVPPVNKLALSVMIQRETGNFEVLEGNSVLVTGRIYEAEHDLKENNYINLPADVHENKRMLKTKDIYKELRLRGYNYKGSFKNLVECNVSGTKGLIKWDGNYVTFIDNMLQLSILHVDTRLLYIPTGIDKLIINASLHAAISKSTENSEIPVEIYPESEIIRSGGIELYGLKSTSIARRRIQGSPVLETYTFVPNIANLDLLHSTKVNMQIILENTATIKLKAVELLDEEPQANYKCLSPFIIDVLADLPLIQPEITILTKQKLDITNITIEDSKLTSKTDCVLIVGRNLLSKKLILNQCFDALKHDGYILSRENLDFELTSINEEDLNITIATIHKTDSETLVLLSKLMTSTEQVLLVKPKNDEFGWLQDLQYAVKNNKQIVLYAQNDSTNGILGLVNCIKRESTGKNLKSVFVMDEEYSFNDVTDKEVINQLKKNLIINIFKNGQWGTYRHLPLKYVEESEAEHCYVNNTVKGDLSSLKWLEGHLTSDTILGCGKNKVKIYYSALNFRDIMIATGRINSDVVSSNRLEQSCAQGFEFAGRDEKGNKIIGLANHHALATELEACPYIQWKIPEFWTMAEAATVPAVYGTCLFALVAKANIKKGDSILIHSGTGGIGQAGIQLALHYGCRVYTTVGNEKKKEFLKKRFPKLTDKNIFNSRNVSFEQNIMKATLGRGVDIVLNSLAEDKQIASARCLAHGGCFLEIGKYDLVNNSTLNLLLLQKEASFHGIMLDDIIAKNEKMKTLVHNLIQNGIKEGAVKPLNTTIFSRDEIEKAYRYMTSGLHTGKILVEIRKEEKQKIYLPQKQLFKCSPRYFCDPQKTYIIIGGLGGFGLELADWLILRGARNLVLTSRNGIKNGYQQLRLNYWKTYGATIIISQNDVTTKAGCEELIQKAEKLGSVHGIFNLAVVLQDAVLENQSIETFQNSFAPKAVATKYLDIVTRKLCPKLRDFVVFSSVSCGRGNAGQSNYGMSNSVMERICEQRFKDGLPAVAIQWGAIGEVGLVAEMQEDAVEIEIGGTLQQSVSSCLDILDIFLKQRETPIVASMVVAQKRTGIGSAENIVDVVGSILGVDDLKGISLHSTLAELGMDSMTAVEIKQTLEREFEVFLTPSDIRTMTFAKLLEIQEQMKDNDQGPSKKVSNNEAVVPTLKMLFTVIGDETTINKPEVLLQSNIQNNDTSQKVLLIPGIEAVALTLLPLTLNLNVNAIGLQVGSIQNESIIDMAKNLYPNVVKHVSTTTPFVMVAHSFGVLVGLELMALLECNKYNGHLICIDGSPEFLQRLLSVLNVGSEALLQTSLIIHLLQMVLTESVEPYKEDIFKCKSFDERIQLGQKIAELKLSDSKYKSQNIFHGVVAAYNRLICLKNYKPSFNKLKSKITLLKPKLGSLKGIEDDFKLSEFTEQEVEVREFEGTHFTILENKELANYINTVLGVEITH